VANGAGLSIAHIGHSLLAGSSINLKNILHILRLSTHLLSVNHLCWDNDIFVEFHHHCFCVKDKSTQKILLHSRSKGGLYPIPLNRASSSAPCRALSGVTASPSQWHQHLGHPTNNVGQTIVKTHDLSCALFDTSLSMCDACQCAKSHQLPYTSSHRISTMPFTLMFGVLLLLPLVVLSIM
jgi:hypothetical protein